MKTILYNATIFVDEKTWYEDKALVIEDGKIVSYLDNFIEEQGVEYIDCKGNYVMPGMIDIHIHGAIGYDFDDCDEIGFQKVQDHLVEDGCTSFLTSLTPMGMKETIQRLDTVSRFTSSNTGANYLGIHMEGPYLSKTYKAVMIEENLRDVDIQEFTHMIEASHNQIKMITIAPELDNMDKLIECANKHAIACMIGHSDASATVALDALNKGAVGFTHLYNAMSQHVHRAPGVVSAAFINKSAYAELIVDGFHVADDVVWMTYINHKDTLVLITDAMLAKGMPDGEYTFTGRTCIKEGISVCVKAGGRRAGSATSMQHVIQKIHQITNCEVSDIVRMACSNPAKVIHVFDHKGSLHVGKDADICIINQAFENQMTIVNGMVCFRK